LGPRAGQDRMRYRLTPNLLDSRYKLERKNARLLKSFGRTPTGFTCISYHNRQKSVRSLSTRNDPKRRAPMPTRGSSVPCDRGPRAKPQRIPKTFLPPAVIEESSQLPHARRAVLMFRKFFRNLCCQRSLWT
jgi:hypothetical protein